LSRPGLKKRAFIPNEPLYGLYLQTQSLLDRRLSLHLRQVPLKAALSAVQRETGVQLVYGDNLLPINRAVTLKAQDAPLSQVLNQMLKPLNLRCKEVASQVITERNVLRPIVNNQMRSCKVTPLREMLPAGLNDFGNGLDEGGIGSRFHDGERTNGGFELESTRDNDH
jgi:hypothetical protein